MLLTATNINDAMSLDTNGLMTALERGGYTDSSIKSCVFLGITPARHFAYKVWFLDDASGDLEEGSVFVNAEQDSSGNVVFVADY